MRILIVEDEPLVRQRLLRLASEHVGKRMRFDCSATLSDAEDRLSSSSYDGVLLDLNLEGEDGFLLLRRLCARAFHTIVVSAHGERALEAFAVGVLDFVAKPFTRERLALALDRLAGIAHSRPAALRWLSVWRAKGTALVAIRDVLYVRADGEHSEIVLSDRSELHDKTIGRLMMVLPNEFLRCHRAFIVHVAHIKELRALAGSRWRLILSNGCEIPVGRAYIASVRAELGMA